jgi:hypothetical protein
MTRGRPIDWSALAAEIGVRPNSGGTEIAKSAIAALLGESALRDAVDWYVESRPAYEHARSVLWLLRPKAAQARCLEIYRTDPQPERRQTAVELMRVVARGDDLPLVHEFLDDPDPIIQIWGVGVLDQLLWDHLVEEEDAEPYLKAAEGHPNPRVRERCVFIRSYTGADDATTPIRPDRDAAKGIPMRLYERLLENEEERRLADEFWRELLSPTAIAYGWRSPWMATVPDDTANLYSASREDTSRGFTLDHMPETDPPLAAWCDTFDSEGDAIDFLRIRTDGSVQHLSTICGLFELWAGTDISGAAMDRLVDKLLAGDRSALLRARRPT